VDQHATDLLTRDAETEVEAELDADARAWLDLRDGVPSVWSRYTDLVVERGSGSWLETVGGERYLDYTSGIGVTSTGHSHPRVVAAIADQAARVIHAQQNIVYHKPGLELHSLLPRRFPNLPPDASARLFLSNSGAEAVEAAVKLAKAATRRPAVIAFRGGFHGRTHGTMSLTSSGVKYRGHFEPLLGGVHHVPYPYPLRNPTGRSDEAALAFTFDAIDELFATMVYPDDVAAFLVEPVPGEGDYVVPPERFLPDLRKLADRHGILLIVDEVQSGYGRTGRFFATEWTDASPDIVVMAKGIASGMPLSGILARGDLLDAFGPGGHGGTYGGNAVACAAALATLAVIDDEHLLANAERQGGRLLSALRTAAAGHPHVAEVRGRGLMLAIELADPDTLAPRPDLAKALLHAAFDRQLLLLTCGTRGQVVRIIPPLVTTDEEIQRAAGVIAESLDKIGA
jgi:4-aminobutyrate aminotransferase